MAQFLMIDGLTAIHDSLPFPNAMPGLRKAYYRHGTNAVAAKGL